MALEFTASLRTDIEDDIAYEIAAGDLQAQRRKLQFAMEGQSNSLRNCGLQGEVWEQLLHLLEGGQE
eukprot:6476156-Amphidinium_carterae.1